MSAAAFETLAGHYGDEVQSTACGVDKTNPNCGAILNIAQDVLAQINQSLEERAAAAGRKQTVVGPLTAMLAQSPAANRNEGLSL